MYIFKEKLSKKDRRKILSILFKIEDSYNDFYITENRKRIFLKDNVEKIWDLTNHGEKVVYCDDGFLITQGYKDDYIIITDKDGINRKVSPRKYIKILAKDLNVVYGLLRMLGWNVNKETFYIKIKEWNPLVRLLKEERYNQLKHRGNELVFFKYFKDYENKSEVKNKNDR